MIVYVNQSQSLCVHGRGQWKAEAIIRMTGCAAELWGPAVQYLRIRALAAPAVLLTMVAQVSAEALPLPFSICLSGRYCCAAPP